MVIPQHVAIILDGNGRWAKSKGMPRNYGHSRGAKNLEVICEDAWNMGIKYLTVYLFSTENWKRPQEEVRAIIELLREYLVDAPNHKDENVQVQFIGDLSSFDDDILKLIADCEAESSSFTGMHLNIAINYGGRDELVHAFQEMNRDIQNGKLSAESVTEDTVRDYLYTKGQPDVDLIIRPSGEYRLSNFLIWQSAYAEYVFMDRILWPDFNESYIDKALEEYASRNRRFGGV